MNILLNSLAILVLCTTPSLAGDESFRVGAWNIKDLHHGHNFKLRPFGTRRAAGDFELLKNYAKQFGEEGLAADIVALQEIGTLKGARLLFPPHEYEIIMSPRYDDSEFEEGDGDIFTAVAVRKDRGISILEYGEISGLAVRHTDGFSVRAATTVLLEADGVKFWFVSLHLKSSCSNTKSIDTSRSDDCETLWKQSEPLTDWIAARRMEGTPFILAGDFNRRFRQFFNEGAFWKKINGGDLNEPWLTQHPETITRKCPTRKGNSTQPIDWILLDATVADWFVEGSYWERRFRREDIKSTSGGKGEELSDHCPISIDISIG